MKKILLALDSNHINENTVRFACYLARLTNSRLTGIFFENMVLEEEVTISRTEGIPVIKSIAFHEIQDSPEYAAERAAGIDLFNSLALKEGIQPEIYLEKGVPLEDILAESRYADMLVVDAAVSFSAFQDEAPTSFVREVLQNAECPVVIAPAIFKEVNNIVLCYEPIRSAVFAIKQFIYLFPELKNKDLKVVCLNNNDTYLQEEMEAIVDWLKQHFENIELIVPDGDAKDILFTYLLNQKNDFVIMGNYGKGLLNAFFSQDERDGTARINNQPIFITHH